MSRSCETRLEVAKTTLGSSQLEIDNSVVPQSLGPKIFRRALKKKKKSETLIPNEARASASSSSILESFWFASQRKNAGVGSLERRKVKGKAVLRSRAYLTRRSSARRGTALILLNCFPSQLFPSAPALRLSAVFIAGFGLPFVGEREGLVF